MARLDPVLAAMARAVTQRPRWTAAILAAVTLAACLLLPRLRIDPDMTAMLPADHPAVELLRATDAAQGTSQMYLLLRGPGLGEALPGIEASLRESDFLVEVAARRGELAPSGGGGEWLVRAPDPVLQRLEAALSPDARRAAIQASKARMAQDPLAGREIVLRDPLGLRWVLDEVERDALPPGVDPESAYLHWPDRELALLRVRGAEEPFDVAFSNRLLDDLAERLKDWEWEGLGGYDVARRDAARIRLDMTRSLGWSIPLLLLFLALSTRSFWRPHLYLLPVGLAVLWALGLGGAWLGPLTPLAVSSAAILMGLGVDFCIHYLDRFGEERATRPYASAVEAAHRGTGRALLLGMLTTVAAFLSLGLGSFPGMGRFGLLLTLGILGSWVAALLVLPLLARRLEPREEPSSWLVRRCAALVRSAAGPWIALALVLLALAGWGSAMAGGLRFDADARHLRSDGDRLAERMGELEGAMGASPLGLRVWVPASADADQISTGVEALLSEGAIARAQGAFEAYAGPRRRERIEAFRAVRGDWVQDTLVDLQQAGFRSEPFEAGLRELEAQLGGAGHLAQPDLDWRGAAYRSLVLFPKRTPPGREAREVLRERVRAELGADLLMVDMAGVGDPLGPLLAKDLVRSVGVCALVVLLVVGLALGRTRDVLAALLPVACGLGVTLGMLAWTDFPLHPGNLLALPLILGLGVDDGIHMVLRWRQSGADPLLRTGTSIWRTTASTVIGFGSLATAASPAIASLGVLAAAGAGACFLATIFGVPLLLGAVQGGD